MLGKLSLGTFNGTHMFMNFWIWVNYVRPTSTLLETLLANFVCFLHGDEENNGSGISKRQKINGQLRRNREFLMKIFKFDVKFSLAIHVMFKIDRKYFFFFFCIRECNPEINKDHIGKGLLISIKIN